MVEATELFKGLNKYKMAEYLRVLSKNYAIKEKRSAKSHEIHQKLHAVKALSLRDKKSDLIQAVKELEEKLSKEFIFESSSHQNTELINDLMQELKEIKQHVKSRKKISNKTSNKKISAKKLLKTQKQMVKKKVGKDVSKKVVKKPLPIKKKTVEHSIHKSRPKKKHNDDKLAEIIGKINKLKEEDLFT